MSTVKKNKDQIQALMALSVEDLNQKVAALREDSFWLQFKNKSGQEINANQIRIAKKDLARALTVLSAKKNA